MYVGPCCDIAPAVVTDHTLAVTTWLGLSATVTTRLESSCVMLTLEIGEFCMKVPWRVTKPPGLTANTISSSPPELFANATTN